MDKNFLEKAKDILDKEYTGNIDLFVEDIRTELQVFEDHIKETVIDEDRPKIIELANITKEYKKGSEIINAVKNINLDVYEGEILVLIGPSGSGKSTLLNLIGGLDKPTTGDIKVNGMNLSKMKDSELSNYRNSTIGFIFQFFYLQPYFTVQQNVEIPLIFRGENNSERTIQSEKAVRSVGLEDRIKHLPKELSGGQIQRVAIARALVNKPKIILADEPTGNLDRATGIQILELLKKINHDLNTTIVIITHDSFIARYADRVIKLSDGKLV